MDLEEQNQAFRELGPDAILDAVEHNGFVTDGRMLALNSYENRVYQIGLDDAEPVVAKFYRPGRWTDEQILEEHEFAAELVANEIPVVPPMQNEDGITLHRHGPYRFSLFERRGGRAPELDDPAHLEILGRFLGRIHAVGAAKGFSHRPALTIETFGYDSMRFLLEEKLVPMEVEQSYQNIAEELLKAINTKFEDAGDVPTIRTHGDMHVGNVLWRGESPHIVDLDDARMAPAMQDLWLLLSGDRPYQTQCLAQVMDGYTDFADFDPRELHLLEPLRALRLMYHAAWIARRWDDPAFPSAFPWFNTRSYWDEHILALHEQLAMMDEPPLPWISDNFGNQ